MEFLTQHELQIYQTKVENPKHKLMIDVLLYTGVRVSEMIHLKWKDIDFQKKIIQVKSLKKRSEKEVIRKIPIAEELFKSFSSYLKDCKNIQSENYIFPSPSKPNEPLRRESVNWLLKNIAKKHNISPAHPHKFRHTFATNMRRTGSELHTISSLLGHENYNTTLIYSHITEEEKQEAFTRAYKEKTFDKIVRKFKQLLGIHEDNIPIINLLNDRQLIGRKHEILQLSDNIQKGISTMIIGEKGVGKSMLIDNLKREKIIRLDDLKGLKNTLNKIIVHLSEQGKSHELELLFGGMDNAKIQKESIRELTRIITSITEEKEFVITIDSIDQLTLRESKFLEELANHFIVICGTRQLKLNVAQTATNFKIIELAPLKRAEAFELTNLLIQKHNIQTDNFELLRNHIVEESRCLPERVSILCQRFGAEKFITEEEIRMQKLVDVHKEFDATFIIILIISGFAILRYLSAEVGNSSYKFIGGIAMIILLFSRTIFTRTRKKTAY